MNYRYNAVINANTSLDYRFFVDGVQSDIYSWTKIEIYNEDPRNNVLAVPIQTILPASINRLTVGQYQYTMSSVATAGIYYDKQYFIPMDGFTEISDIKQITINEIISIPSSGIDPIDMRNHLEGYCEVTTSSISDAWIIDERDNTVIPYVNNFCQTDIQTEQTAVEWYSGNGTDTMILNRRNINSIVSIELVKAYNIFAGISVSSVDIISAEGILKAKTNLNEGLYVVLFPKGKDNIKITYKYGGSLPNDLKQAVKKLCCILMLDNIEGRTGGGGLGVMAYNKVYGNMGKYSNIRKRLSDQAHTILRRYSNSGVVGA
jgi:hypothetical protein